MRVRQPGDLVVSLCYDFAEVDVVRGYTYLEARTVRHDVGEFRMLLLRETRSGRKLSEIALTTPEDDLARWTFVIRPAGESRVLASCRLLDVDVDFGYADGAAADSIAVYGDTYTAMFETVIVTPTPATVPSTTGLFTWPAATDPRTGPAETVGLSLIADHFGPAAPVPAHRFARLNVPASLGRGSTVTVGRRFPTLLDELRVIGDEGGVTFRLEQGDDGVVDVVVRESLPRPEVTLSTSRNTLLAWRVRRSARRATRALILGKGEEAARVATLVPEAVPVGGWAYPRTVAVNASSEDELEPMRLEGREELADLNRRVAVSLRPAPGARWVAGLDYELGDLLPIAEQGVELEAIVAEIDVVHRAGNLPDVTSEVGSSLVGPVAALLNPLRRIVRRETNR